jgi:protein gp37
MYRDKKRYGQDASVVVRSAKTTFNKPLHWKDPARVFTCSWSDFFIEDADQWRDDAWDIIRRTPHLTYMILTKRPERIISCLPDDWGNGYPNVWLGVTAENQERADIGIPILLSVSAAKRFVSVEPMLGPVDLWDYLPNSLSGKERLLDWVIIGGESGPKARPMERKWATDVLNQCLWAKTPFFYKQGPDDNNEINKIPKLGGIVWNQIPRQ